MQIYDCEPTLTDRKVIEFCKHGFIALEGVISDEVNKQTLESLNARPPEFSEPIDLLTTDWFVDGVLLNREVTGAVRSLLGANFGMPIQIANHRGECPAPDAVGWHCDGYSRHTIEVNHLMIFYLPQECTVEMGPSELVPGSHFLLATSHLVHHYGNIAGTHKATGTAGTVFLMNHAIWHRRSRPTATSGVRHMLKYYFWRQTPPVRDWIIEEDFDPGAPILAFQSTHPNSYRRNMQDCHDAAEQYMWLCGHHEEFKPLAAGAWPVAHQGIDKQYGIPPSLQRVDS